ncbi:MAG: acyl-ACP--UDP-N-acetylglucosamine O-acyltransferase [Gemmatimonadales bacterium]|nr:MAG: acyl-ACP--UDP-N-acetylglucosamine O-acyltransferase [Gemmatimonadales bacterium]
MTSPASHETALEEEVQIHETAIIDESAELGQGVKIGPRAIIGPQVRIGSGTDVGPGVLVERNTEVGSDCRIFQGAVLGTDPQDLKFEGEETWLRIGDRTMIREYATLNRGTSWSRETVVGSDCLLMAYVHVAHDCHLGNHIIVSNATQMAGHVTIEDWAIVSGLVAVHQFVRIGAHAFVGGASRIAQDVIPYCRVVGNPPKLYGLNSVGLERRGFGPEARKALKRAYRQVFQSDLNISQGVARVREEQEVTPEVEHFLAFIESSERGVSV